MEVKRLIAVFVHHLVPALRRAQAVEVHAVILVGGREVAPVGGAVVCAVVEAVGAVPGRAGKLGPLDVVVEQTARRGIHHIDFSPVGAGARHGVCRVSAVGAHVHARERHGAVVAQGVGVDKYLGILAVRLRGAVEHSLIAQAVVDIEIILAVVLAPGQARFLIVHQGCEAAAYGVAEGHGVEHRARQRVLGLDPGQRGGRGVVFERAVDVAYLDTRHRVGGAVLRGGGI